MYHKTALSDPQVYALLEACQGEQPVDLRDHTIIATALITGLEREALCALRFNAPVGREYLLETTTRHGPYAFKIGERLWRELFRPWVSAIEAALVLGRPKEMYLFRRLVRIEGAAQAVTEHVLSSDGLYKMLRGRAKRANFRGVAPHRLRLTWLAWANNLKRDPALLWKDFKERTGYKIK